MHRLFLFSTLVLVSFRLEGSFKVELPAGRSVKVLLNEPLNIGPVSEGQTLMCKGYEGVVIQDVTVITHGTPAHARIVDIEWTRKKKIQSVTIEVMDITAVDGQSIPLNSAALRIVVHETANGIGQLLSATVASSVEIEVKR